MNKPNLLQLYLQHRGKAAHKWSSYLDEYDRLFEGLRDKPVAILEVGVQNGGSLDIWSKYFESASAIVGIDINPKCKSLIYDDPRIHIVIGNVNDPQVISDALSHSSQFEIIIDDGSHTSQDIIKTFINLFPYLSDDGFFVIEDLHCSYWETFNGGIFHPFSSITFFQRLVDILNFEHWGVEKSKENLLAGFIEKYSLNIDPKVLGNIHSIEFLNSMCILKKSIQDKGLGHHIAIGDSEFVVQGNLDLNGLPYKLDSIFIQNTNYWSTLEAPPANLLCQIQAKLSESEQQILNLKREVYTLISSRDQIQAKLSESEQQILNLEEEVYTLTSSRDQIQAKLSESEQQILNLEREVYTLTSSRDQIQAKLSESEQQISILKKEIHDFKNSILWKIAVPLRYLVKVSRSNKVESTLKRLKALFYRH